MKESKNLEFHILNFLVENDDYNRGIPESFFLSSFMSENASMVDKECGCFDFPRNIVIAHLLLMEQRDLISYSLSSTENGKMVGPVKAGGYDYYQNYKIG